MSVQTEDQQRFLASGLVEWLAPDWPAPPHVRALVTSRRGGMSKGVWSGLNLAYHVGDSAAHVSKNRSLLLQQLPSVNRIQWLHQVHGCAVAELNARSRRPGRKTADAACVRLAGDAAVVMTADCLPVFFTDVRGSCAGVAHAGWRGLLNGILEHTVTKLGSPRSDVLAWLGPAIGSCHFQVGDEVRSAFLARAEETSTKHDVQHAFTADPAAPDKWLMDIYAVARVRLRQAGVLSVYGGGLCTVCDTDHFYSYRREGVTGRMASVIYINPA
jgi:polyphenol oxidase